MKFLDIAGLEHLISKLRILIDSKVQKEAGKQLTDENFTKEEKDKLQLVEDRANRIETYSQLKDDIGILTLEDKRELQRDISSKTPEEKYNQEVKNIWNAMNNKSFVGHTHSPDDVYINSQGDKLSDISAKHIDYDGWNTVKEELDKINKELSEIEIPEEIDIKPILRMIEDLESKKLDKNTFNEKIQVLDQEIEKLNISLSSIKVLPRRTKTGEEDEITIESVRGEKPTILISPLLDNISKIGNNKFLFRKTEGYSNLELTMKSKKGVIHMDFSSVGRYYSYTIYSKDGTTETSGWTRDEKRFTHNLVEGDKVIISTNDTLEFNYELDDVLVDKLFFQGEEIGAVYDDSPIKQNITRIETEIKNKANQNDLEKVENRVDNLRLSEITIDIDLPKGEKGDPGPQGPRGDKGEPGLDGVDGKDGERGPEGPKGERGLQGRMGPQGPKGEDGDIGPRGPEGPRGFKGEKGEPGPAGPKGDKGDPGPRGYSGTDGKDGARGPKGDTGPAGKDGSDAKVTSSNIRSALGYTPANQRDINDLKQSGVERNKELVDALGSKNVIASVSDSLKTNISKVYTIKTGGGSGGDNGVLKPSSKTSNALVYTSQMFEIWEDNKDKRRVSFGNGMLGFSSGKDGYTNIGGETFPTEPAFMVNEVTKSSKSIAINFSMITPKWQPANAGSSAFLKFIFIFNQEMFTLSHVIEHYFQKMRGSEPFDIFMYGTDIESFPTVGFYEYETKPWSLNGKVSGFRLEGKIEMSSEFFTYLGFEDIKPTVVLSGAVGSIE